MNLIQSLQVRTIVENQNSEKVNEMNFRTRSLCLLGPGVACPRKTSRFPRTFPEHKRSLSSKLMTAGVQAAAGNHNSPYLGLSHVFYPKPPSVPIPTQKGRLLAKDLVVFLRFTTVHRLPTPKPPGQCFSRLCNRLTESKSSGGRPKKSCIYSS